MKREFNILTLGLLVSLLMLSCKKEHVTTNTNSSPVFYFKGMIGGTAMDLQAGINNYYMYSSYTQSSGVYCFTGTLKNTASSLNSISSKASFSFDQTPHPRLRQSRCKSRKEEAKGSVSAVPRGWKYILHGNKRGEERRYKNLKARGS